MAAIDITGLRFGRLTVIERVEGRHTLWRCQCSCGNEIIVRSGSLRAGTTRSCGCFSNESRSERMTTHGMSKTPLYFVWNTMIQRCHRPSSPSWADYGGRGIKVAKRWRTFQNFYEDMGDRPSPQHTLERINNSKGYEPGNVKWATRRKVRTHAAT
jgi:hypothetical protein